MLGNVRKFNDKNTKLNFVFLFRTSNDLKKNCSSIDFNVNLLSLMCFVEKVFILLKDFLLKKTIDKLIRFYVCFQLK